MISWKFYILFYVKWPVEFGFLINFDRCTKLTDLWQFFRKKKVDIIENYDYGDIVKESPIMIFWLFFILFYEKWPIEFDFPINFDREAKLTDLS